MSGRQNICAKIGWVSLANLIIQWNLCSVKKIYILHGVLSPSEAVGRSIFHNSLLLLWTLSINLNSNTMEFVIRTQGTQVMGRERECEVISSVRILFCKFSLIVRCPLGEKLLWRIIIFHKEQTSQYNRVSSGKAGLERFWLKKAWPRSLTPDLSQISVLCVDPRT